MARVVGAVERRVWQQSAIIEKSHNHKQNASQNRSCFWSVAILVFLKKESDFCCVKITQLLLLLGETEVTDEHNGQFKVAYRSATSGAWYLDVKLDEAPIAGSPFDITLAWALSTGALVGIAGAALGLLLLIGGAFFFMKKRRSNKYTWERL
jgi:hypothetical protein